MGEHRRSNWGRRLNLSNKLLGRRADGSAGWAVETTTPSADQCEATVRMERDSRDP